MKHLFFGVAILLFVALYFHNVIEFDQDLGRHLLTGKIIWQTQTVPKTNLFSYTQTDFPFVNSHWLSEVVFYLVGASRLIYFKTLILVTAMTLALYTAYKYSKSLIATALAFAVFSPVLLERTEIRPEIFSYLFMAIFMYVLLLKPKLIWLLPILQLFWVNMHIYFIIGPVLVFIFRRFSLPVLLVLLALLVNPNGFAGAIYPLTVFNNYGYAIVENQNIFFLQNLVFNPNILYFELAAVMFIISCILNFRKLSATSYLLSAFLALPAWHIRSFPLLFLILLPVFAANLTRFKSQYVVIFVVVLTLFRAWRLADDSYYYQIGANKRFGAEIVPSYKGAVDFVQQNNLRGPIFNNFDLGSYLAYRLYPGELVFVDGRPEAYPKEFFQNLYIPMQQTTENFAAVDNIYKFNLIIFSRTDITPWAQNFLGFIANNPKYKLVYLDNNAVVFANKNVYPNVTSYQNLVPTPSFSKPDLILF